MTVEIWVAVVETPSGREEVRVVARREYCPDLEDWTVWHATVHHPAGEGYPAVADKIEARAVVQALIYAGAAWRWRLVSLARANKGATWIPWPTDAGFWWARERPGAPVCVVEARVEAESSWIYFSGLECPLYANEPREAWEFCRAELPRSE